jgi:hypothetical protein
MVPHHYTKPPSWAREGLDLDHGPGDATGRGTDTYHCDHDKDNCDHGKERSYVPALLIGRCQLRARRELQRRRRRADGMIARRIES